MTCRKQGCGYEFCWICMGDWKTHSACNRFKKDETADEAKSVLERYLHYYHRYKTHMDSQTAETRLRETAVHKMIELQQTNNSIGAKTVDWIFVATEQLIECRRTLKYTYVFAFYLPDGSKEKNLFEWLQEELETTTERLSGHLEKPLTGSSAERRQISDIAALAKRRLDHLLDGVKEGLTSGARFTPDGKEIHDTPMKERGSIMPVLFSLSSNKKPKPKPTPKKSGKHRKKSKDY